MIIVSIRSKGDYEGCSGELVEIRDNGCHIVELPNGLRLAYSKHELEWYKGEIK